MKINEVLLERNATHGDYNVHALITQRLKDVIYTAKKPSAAQDNGIYCRGLLNTSQRESLDMIVHKIGRILAGDPDHKDHWIDIAGYAMLIANQLPDAK